MRHLSPELSRFQRFFDGNRQLVKVERLADIVVGAHAHRLDRRLQHPQGGNHDDNEFLIDGFGFFQHVQAVYTRQLDIKQHQVG